MVSIASEQAFSPVLHEVIVSELQSHSRSWAGPVHAEALMWLLLLFWDPAELVLDCSNVDNSRQKSGKQNMGSGREEEITEDSTWRSRERERERERESHQCLKLIRWWLQCQELNKRFISFWGSVLVWCCEFLPHKSVHDSACEEGYSIWSIYWLTGPVI